MVDNVDMLPIPCPACPLLDSFQVLAQFDCLTWTITMCDPRGNVTADCCYQRGRLLPNITVSLCLLIAFALWALPILFIL